MRREREAEGDEGVFGVVLERAREERGGEGAARNFPVGFGQFGQQEKP